jgi:predicted RNA polymerase sigma factor
MATGLAADLRTVCRAAGDAAAPVVELNRAAAVAMHEGPAAGLVLIEALFTRGKLRDYHLAHSARADLFRRLGRRDEAREPTGRRGRWRNPTRRSVTWKNDSMNSAERYFLPRVENRPCGSTNL